MDKIGVDKLKTVSVDISKLHNVADYDIAKKTEYGELLTKVNAIDTKVASTNGLVSKTQYNSYK